MLRRHGPTAAILALALALRLLYFVQVREQPLFREPILDAQHYSDWGKQIAGGDWLGKDRGVFVMSPGYPYWIGAVYRIAGPRVDAVVLLQFLAGLLTGWILCLLGTRLFSRAAGLAAMALYLFNPQAIFFEGVLEKAALVNLVNAAVLALAVWGGPARLLAAGALTGVSAQLRPNALLLVPLLLAWVILHEGRRGRAALLFLLGLALALLPAAARNYAVGGEPVLTTAHGGMNLYTGNAPGSRGPYAPLTFARSDPAHEQEDFRAEASRRSGRSLSRSASDAFWMREAFAAVREHPLRWLGLELRKVLIFLNAYEQPINLDFYLFREQVGSVLAWPLPGYALLLPLAAAGLLLAPLGLLLGGYLLAYLASGLLFFVVSEYRFAVVPVLAIAAGAGLAAIPGHLRTRRFGLLALAAGAFATGLFLARFDLYGRVLGLPGFERTTLASSYYNLGTVLANRGDVDGAIRALEKSLALAPGARPLQVLGDLRLRKNDIPAALRAYEESLRRIPYPEAWSGLGLARAGAGDLSGAEAAFREAVRIDPSSAAARFTLGDCLDQQGRSDEALLRYAEALRLDPGHPEAHNNSGVILDRRGRAAEAEAHYRAALATRPDYADARGNLARNLAAQGRKEEALPVPARRTAPGR
jgi:Flp pilus assembly protein TadD/4-amino-4-deoxy-L-arabinose transferase-like glycosyltransferase